MRILTIIPLCLLLAVGCSSRADHEPAGQDRCTTNMMEVWWELHNWIGDGDRWPPSFASLSDTTNTSIFVCPYTGHKAGSLTNVEEWTDYIYIGGASEGMCDVALLIWPPE